VDGKSLKNIGKSTYGERVGFTASSDTDSGQLRVSFTKNGNSVRFVGFLCSCSSLAVPLGVHDVDK